MDYGFPMAVPSFPVCMSLHARSAHLPEQMKCDMKICNFMITSKYLYPFVATFQGNYFISFDPLLLGNCSGLGMYYQPCFINDIFLLGTHHDEMRMRSLQGTVLSFDNNWLILDTGHKPTIIMYIPYTSK